MAIFALVAFVANPSEYRKTELDAVSLPVPITFSFVSIPTVVSAAAEAETFGYYSSFITYKLLGYDLFSKI